MAGLGHEERFPPIRLSGGCGFRKETISGMRRNGRDAPIPAVRGVPIESINSTRGGRSPALLDNLIGAGEDRGRHSEAERIGGLEVDDELDPRGLLDR
jgi:hypothetical protein